MQKISLPYLNSKSPVPIVRLSRSDNDGIYALLDTGAESSIYDISLKETHPELFIETRCIGKGELIGVSNRSEVELYNSRIRIEIEEAETLFPLEVTAFEHQSLSENIKPLIEHGGLMEKVLLIIGSDALQKYQSVIDMKKKAVTFYISNK